MLRVGLTGSIGVGKSFVTSVLRELGCYTTDADQVAREVVASGTKGLAAVVTAFGDGILTPEGTLDRKALGDLVFADESKRKLLNAILHPFIITRQDELMQQWELKDPNSIGVIDAALMIESGGYKRFDKLIVVYCRPEVQLRRLMERDQISQTEAEQKIQAQMSQEAKLKFADFTINTSEGFADTRKQTEEVYRQLREIAAPSLNENR
jgi:dephospho-CoA kinase